MIYLQSSRRLAVAGETHRRPIIRSRYLLGLQGDAGPEAYEPCRWALISDFVQAHGEILQDANVGLEHGM